MRTPAFASLLVASLVACQPSQVPAPETAESNAAPVPYAPHVTPSTLGIAGYAKVLCSALFVSGRELERARHESGYFLVPERDRADTTIKVDEDAQVVRITLRDELTREARFYGDQGCVITPQGADGVYFTPEPVVTSLPDASTMPWPMGDQLPGTTSDGIDRAALDEAVDAAFRNRDSLTAAFVVVHRGEIVSERYAHGAHEHMQLESWSMGKSITATLVALLMRDGAFELDDPAPVPSWQNASDPRRAITLRNLLNMSSGLHFIAPRDPDYSPDKGYPDHMFIYTGAIDAFEHSYSKPLQFPPGTEGRYRNSDPLTLGYLIKRAVAERGESYFTFPQRALFDRIGIRRQVLEPDPYGNFLLTGYDYGTARNWARLGLLYLQDGVWMGERLLPEGFVEFVSTPAPAWEEPVYGGQFWINGTREFALPERAYYMAGGGGQRTFIVPTHDLVIVRMGHFRGDGPQMRAELNEALEGILSAITPESES